MSKIDELDERILRQLLKDGRKSFADIAIETNVSKDVIAKRYKKMKKMGIITGATTQVNYRVLGYSAFGDIVINVEPKNVDDVIKYIQKIPNTKEILTFDKNYNLFVVVSLRNLIELDHIREEIRKHAAASALKTHLWLDVKNTPENLSISRSHEDDKNQLVEIRESTENEKKSKIDEIDIQIIEKLSTNGRLPFMKIAEELKISTDTVARRFEMLKNNKALKVVIQIDPTKIGYQAEAIFSISLTTHCNSANAITELSNIPDLWHIMKTSGDYDLAVITIVKSFEHFFKIRNKIAKLPYVKIADIEILEIRHVWPIYQSYISTFN